MDIVRIQFKKKEIPQHLLKFFVLKKHNGWILRNKLVWIKPNAMPESVEDRWKKAHEYIFFFVKSKKYYFNLDAIRTPHKQVSLDRAEYELGRNAMGLNPSSVGEKYSRDKNNRGKMDKYFSMPSRRVKLNPAGACPPDYLIVNTNCSENDGSDEHYATYPQALVNPLILSGCPKGGIVLDIFNGSGTTCWAAKKLNRSFMGIDLNPKYCQIARERIRQEILL